MLPAPKTYTQRINEIALNLAILVHGEKGSSCVSDFIPQAEFCMQKVSESFGHGLLKGIEHITLKSDKLPSELLFENGYIPQTFHV